jgi:hypothetical protein
VAIDSINDVGGILSQMQVSRVGYNSNGAVNYSVAVSAPKCRGIEPDISLSYSSAAGAYITATRYENSADPLMNTVVQFYYAPRGAVEHGRFR